MTYDWRSMYLGMNLQDLAHTPRRRVRDVNELTPEERRISQDIGDAFRALMHELVVGDAISFDDKSWGPIRAQAATAVHCSACSGLTIGAAIAIIADLFYEAHPQVTRDTFVEEYSKRFDVPYGQATS